MSLILGVALLSVPGAAPPLTWEWGGVKGRVVFSGDRIPENKKVHVTSDRKYCLSKGPILRDLLVIDKKTKGVRWVIVWLAPVKDFRNQKAGDVPIHPTLKRPPKEVRLRATCCKFEPRVVAIRQGTELVIEQGDKVAHSVKLDSGVDGPQIGTAIPPGKLLEVGTVKARARPIEMACTIHPWMKGWLFASHHPYVAVTDEQGRFAIKNAPAGRWRLVLWQEESGYFPFRSKNDVGLLIEIRGGKTTDAGAVKLTPEDLR